MLNIRLSKIVSILTILIFISQQSVFAGNLQQQGNELQKGVIADAQSPEDFQAANEAASKELEKKELLEKARGQANAQANEDNEPVAPEEAADPEPEAADPVAPKEAKEEPLEEHEFGDNQRVVFDAGNGQVHIQHQNQQTGDWEVVKTFKDIADYQVTLNINVPNPTNRVVVWKVILNRQNGEEINLMLRRNGKNFSASYTTNTTHNVNNTTVYASQTHYMYNGQVTQVYESWHSSSNRNSDTLLQSSQSYYDNRGLYAQNISCKRQDRKTVRYSYKLQNNGSWECKITTPVGLKQPAHKEIVKNAKLVFDNAGLLVDVQQDTFAPLTDLDLFKMVPGAKSIVYRNIATDKDGRPVSATAQIFDNDGKVLREITITDIKYESIGYGATSKKVISIKVSFVGDDGQARTQQISFSDNNISRIFQRLADGTPESQIHYHDDGKIEFSRTYHKNGRTKEYKTYSSTTGKLTLHKTFYATGQEEMYKTFYRSGKLELWITRHPNGNKAYVASFYDNDKNQIANEKSYEDDKTFKRFDCNKENDFKAYRSWYEDGTIRQEIEYWSGSIQKSNINYRTNGQFDQGSLYDEEGNITHYYDVWRDDGSPYELKTYYPGTSQRRHQYLYNRSSAQWYLTEYDEEGTVDKYGPYDAPKDLLSFWKNYIASRRHSNS